MFLKYLEPIFRPFRTAKQKYLQAKQVPDRIKGDAGRAKALAKRGQDAAAQGKKQVAGASAEAKKVQGQAQQAAGKAQGAAGAAKGAAAGAAGATGGGAAAGNAKPGVKKVGLFGRKKVCAKCGQELDKSWDSCPFCAQNESAAPAPAAGPPASSKTAAFMLDGGGGGGGTQMQAWLVPLKGPQRGELYTLAPVSSVGTDPTCTVVLSDQFMSSKHAEIKAQGGVWILKDLGSTNGTYVNDKKIDKHELVDNDFVKFGSSLVKFKSL